MNGKQLVRSAIICMAGALVILGCAIGGSTARPTAIPPKAAPPTAVSKNPKAGIWNATAEFGTFKFVVNAAGNGVNEYDFDGSTVTTDDESGYPIKDSKFGSNLSFIVITGTFSSSTSASGTWKYVQKGGSGTWTATWAGPK
jgi:hypothetical protein